ncbi:hypothetical protein AA0112_g5461 [Alternaria arborescens]|uniref:hypothetical protein n=1 Tax=Alternaria arborescens TaxID=156630 RepID=UPI001074EA7C|nr:hypothetical protein AA0111_g3315 [Alternaria arborescens]RYN34791.1 hypothetical protein AA0112_g5461 [Alternaria arborescens]RYO34921.1 hypothetical protein AA0111_g3315 [Alternaria arborescens]
MSAVPWKQEINFGSALLLHSCITVFLKEISNGFAVLYHLSIRHRDKAGTKTSIVLDGYTSVFSKDHDGELAELYFTNTGFILLIVSLACAIAMNLLLPATVLNTLIAATFGLTFFASTLVACRERSLVMPIMALRRAGRFIWSDTPFVNFFTLIYVAVVLKGSSDRIVLRDYVVFRSIAILELVFMKARIAAASVDIQQTMLERLLNSEYVMVRGKAFSNPRTAPPLLERDRIVSFSSSQRLSVMLYKTTIGYADGSLCGASGPAAITVPKNSGFYIDEAEERGWRIYRVSPSLIVIEDCVQVMITKLRERAPTKERRGLVLLFTRFIAWTHGVLLRRLGRRRVVWLSRTNGHGSKEDYWRGNANLVTGLKESWLHNRQKFKCLDPVENDSLISYEIIR